MDIRLDRDSEIPLGVQLAWHLKARIVQGELDAGARLPSVREMAAETGVNANTVRAVYARLEAEGLLETHHGRGTFVTPDAQTGDELAAIASRAAREAAAAGLDPRAVAATLYVGGSGAEAPVASPPQPPRGRLLTTSELVAMRDELRERLDVLLSAPDAGPAPQDERQHSTAPNVKVTLASGAPSWRMGHT